MHLGLLNSLEIEIPCLKVLEMWIRMGVKMSVLC